MATPRGRPRSGRSAGREQSGGILPQIPSSGHAARLGPHVLVSAFEASDKPRTAGRLRQSTPMSARAATAAPLDTQASVQSMRALAARSLRVEDVVGKKTCKALYQYDNIHLLSQNSGAENFDGHDDHDEGFNDVAPRGPNIFEDISEIASTLHHDFSSESLVTLQSLQSVPEPARKSTPLEERPQPIPRSRELRHPLIPRVSLKTLLAKSSSEQQLSTVVEVQIEAGESSTQAFLRASFAHSLADVGARFCNIESNLCNDARALHDWEHDNTLEEYPDAEFVSQTYDWAQVESMQIRPPAAMPFVDDKEQGSIPLRAERREIYLCTAQLNFYRWLCGLRPVRLIRPCQTICDIIGDSLLPRSQPSQAVTSSQQAKLAEVLCDYVLADGDSNNAQRGTNDGMDDDINDGGNGHRRDRRGSRAVIIHGDGSLLTAVEQCVIGYNPETDHHPAEAPKQSRGAMARELALRVLSRRHEQTDKRSYREKLRQLSRPVDMKGIQASSQGMQPHEFNGLPAKLSPIEIFWELHEHGSPRRATPLHEHRKLALKLNMRPPLHMVKRLPSIGARGVRTELCPESSSPRSSAAFWGDQDSSLRSRRYFLNPALTVFGASRQQDTCILWSGDDLGQHVLPQNNSMYVPGSPDLPSPKSARKKDSFRQGAATPIAPEKRESQGDANAFFIEEKVHMDVNAVCFPPAGFVPLELIKDTRTPWTIMPDSHRYQPTEKVRVRIWRCRISMPKEGEWSSERLDELIVTDLRVDCSSLGNPFCIIFRPEIVKISNRDEFEVQLSGLCGARSDLTFFHHFRAMRQDSIDDHLVEAAGQLRAVYTNMNLWREAQAYIPAEPWSHGHEGGRRGKHHGHGKKHQFQGSTDIHHSSQGPISMTQIGLVSHPTLEIQTETVDVTISLCCGTVEAIVPALYLARVSGNEEVPRAVQVCRIGDQFIVRAKMPMSSARYELHFLVNPKSAPETSIPHPLKYTILTNDVCPNLLASLQTPQAQKFGLAPLLPTTQIHGISIISPVSYRVGVGQTLFLLHFQHWSEAADTQRKEGRTSAPSPSVSIQTPNGNTSTPRSPVMDEQLPHGTTLFSHRLRKKDPEKRGGRKTQTTNYAADMHEALGARMKDNCQDSFGKMHLDVSIGGKYVTRLQQRTDLPELFEGLLSFAEIETSSRVEIFLRQPRSKVYEYAPEKLGEWLVCSAESLPPGF